MVAKGLKRLFGVLAAGSGYCLAAAACLLMMVSCKETDEWEKFKPAEFDVEGITLTQHDGGFKYTGTISPEGAKFVITGKGEHVDFVRLSKVGVNNEIIYIRGSSQAKAFIDGEWGEIKELADKVPFIAEFNISPNTTNEDRIFYFDMGEVYIETDIYITQPPIDN